MYLGGVLDLDQVQLVMLVATVAWFVCTPVWMSKLVEFCRRIRPGGPGWAKVRAAATGDMPTGESLSAALLDWAMGCMFVIGITIGLGKYLLGYDIDALIWGAVAVGAFDGQLII